MPIISDRLMNRPLNEASVGDFIRRRVGRFRLLPSGKAVQVSEIHSRSSDGPFRTSIANTHQTIAALTEDNDNAEPLCPSERTQCPGGDGPSRFFLAAIRSGAPLVAGVVDWPGSH